MKRKRKKAKIRRPPREWIRHCSAAVRESGSAENPNAVCGSLWYNKLSARQRAAIKRRYKS